MKKTFIVEIECSWGNGKPTVDQFNQVLENACFKAFRDNISNVSEVVDDKVTTKSCDFNIKDVGVFNSRKFTVIRQGMSGSGNEHFRIIKFHDNGEELSTHKDNL